MIVQFQIAKYMVKNYDTPQSYIDFIALFYMYVFPSRIPRVNFLFNFPLKNLENNEIVEKNEKSQGRYLPGDLMKHLETPRKTGRVSSYACGACSKENAHLFRCRAQPEGKFSTLRTCTRSIVDANDAKIVRSGDAQCNTKKSLSAGRCSFY